MSKLPTQSESIGNSHSSIFTHRFSSPEEILSQRILANCKELLKPGLGVQPDIETAEVLPHEWDHDDKDKEKGWDEEEEWEEWNQEEEDEWKQDDGKHVDKTWNV